MFHISYPKFRGFFTWDELGCLARGLGFPIDLFKDNLAEEIEQEEHGITLLAAYKMLDNRLLERATHRTQNLHTAEWNMNTIRKSLSLLDHRAITFEELYNTRIAYQAYEGFDMMGLHLDKQILLNTLKMCGRSIAPMKLLNRVKHMTDQLEEKGRIQLYEFLDLVLWCGIYENFSPEDIKRPEGKERDLFKLVDFEKLLSHHDERLAAKLNAEYLVEEWDFGKEHLGSKAMFKDPPVRCGEDRVNMARRQKRLYRHLKSEVNNSQKGVYRAKAGYIRQRPLTAPDLSMYTPRDNDEDPPQFTAQTAYEIMQRKVRLSKPGDGAVTLDTSDRPQYVESKVEDKPRVITDDDLQDTQKKFEVLQFDMETIDGRFQIMMDDTMDTLYPGYTERMKEEFGVPKPRPKSEILMNKRDDFVTKERPKSESHLTRKQLADHVVRKLAYPEPCLPPTHARACDARSPEQEADPDNHRFRGWHETKTKHGNHYVLVKPSFSNSYQGKLHERLTKTADIPVQKVKGDFLHRRTKKSQVTTGAEVKSREPRPSTAPATVKSGSDSEIHAVDGKYVSPGYKNLSPAESCKTDLSVTESCKTMDTGYSSYDDRCPSSEAHYREDCINSKSKSEHLVVSPNDNFRTIGKTDLDMDKQYSHESSSPAGVTLSSKHSRSRSTKGATHKSNNGKRGDNPHKKKLVLKPEEEVVPHMEHSKPRPVSVGAMGTISLLENITEARYWEDVYNTELISDTSDDTGNESDQDTRTESSTDSGIRRRQGEELQSSLALLKQRLSEKPIPEKVKPKRRKDKVKSYGDDIVCDSQEREMRIKRQRRSQRPNSKTSQKLVKSSVTEPSGSVESRAKSSANTHRSTGSESSGQTSAGTSRSSYSTKKSPSVGANRSSYLAKQSPSMYASHSTSKSSNFQQNKETTLFEKNTIVRNLDNTAPNNSDDNMMNVKKSKVGRLLRRGEGLLSKEMMHKLVAIHA